MTMLLPSIYPDSRKPCRSASRLGAAMGEDAGLMKPIRGIFVGCCAWATAPTATNTKAMTDSPANFRFWISDFRLSEKNFEGNCFIGLFFWAQSKIQNVKSKMVSLDHLIRSGQDVRRNRQADLIRSFEIDYQLKLRRLFDWQIGGIHAF